ncbi:hypothetical protein PMAYCL1PPCAC_25097, partial [Pristionchus mayeri]
IFSYTTTTGSILANSVLIVNIVFTTLNNVCSYKSKTYTIGAYRWMQIIFAVTDILISIVHCFMRPVIHMTEFGYIFWPYGVLDQPTSNGLAGIMIWFVIYYESLILLAFHYVYRYVVLCDPPWFYRMQQHPWRNWLILAFIANVYYTGSLCLAVYIGWKPNEESRRAFAPAL